MSHSETKSKENRGRGAGSFLLAAASKARALSDIAEKVTAGSSLRVAGVSGSGLAFVLAFLRLATQRPIVLIARGPGEMERIAGDLETIAGDGVFTFPSWETLPEEEIEPHPDILGDRFLLLQRLAAGESAPPPLIVTTFRSISQRLAPPDAFSAELIELTCGMNLSMERLTSYLERGGYRRVDMVEEKGDYCVRGGIVDLFPPTVDYPLRCDFFGERLETIRAFHAGDQRSISGIPGEKLTPCSELALTRRYREALGTFLDYLTPETIIAVHEPAACWEEFERAGWKGRFFIPAPDLYGALSKKQIVQLSLLPEYFPLSPSAEAVALEFRSIEPYRGLVLGKELGGAWEKRIFGHVERWIGEGLNILVSCNNTGESRRLQELLETRGGSLPPGSRVVIGRLSEGFIFPDARLVVLTDREIFARYAQRRPRRRFKGTAPGREFSSFTPGDWVVHVRHGIGRYLGIRKLVKRGREREFLCIEYRDRAKLYVPLDQANLVERYIGPGKTLPALDRLGGRRWQAVRSAAQRAIFDYAAEILELQAVRDARHGNAFGPDTDWQEEFERAFIYEETPDQAAAIEDVKRDMERPRPMDRLVCGDVGYGKTEVAMRSAFKAVVEGKQVAVLVPTTVLAQQHLQTFTDRFADYPVCVEMLSRFRTAKEQRSVLEGLRKGTVDIVIGTHRLVQADVSFRELGLVIIDEEQRFGVRHKEELKRLRMTVDVLTMTATPIPRTLYMSLSGIRDMSTISTPPEDRLAIETRVCEYDDGLIRDAIRRELARQGQVYFVHNRVETIGRVREALGRLVPEAAIGVAHGQMADDELEEVMRIFVEGKIDVLVCTTIIESGLDIPNVNTIIVDRADRFGLADLYQLRGRVGRYKHRAYAYLLYPAGAGLLDDARRRLKAIVEHASLGSGFKIALRDLEIRGAGNILGPEQHGHIAAVGFDLYCKLLKISIEALRGREVRGVEEIEVHHPFAAELPADYIPADPQRIDLYKRIGEVSSDEDVDDIASELGDRFGPLPEAARLLLEVCRLKLRARDRGISSVRLSGDKIIAVRKGEDLRPGGRYPRVTRGKPLELVREMSEAIEKL